MKLKSLVLWMACVLLTTSTALAQAEGRRGHKAPEEKAAAMTQRMTRELTLTAEQQTKVTALNNQLVADLAALRADNPPTDKAQKADRRAKMQAIRATYDEQLKAAISADQYSLYEKKRSEQKEKMQQRRQERGKK
jgi:periplasmic protein CpxP/Spy